MRPAFESAARYFFDLEEPLYMHARKLVWLGVAGGLLVLAPIPFVAASQAANNAEEPVTTPPPAPEPKRQVRVAATASVAESARAAERTAASRSGIFKLPAWPATIQSVDDAAPAGEPGPESAAAVSSGNPSGSQPDQAPIAAAPESSGPQVSADAPGSATSSEAADTEPVEAGTASPADDQDAPAVDSPGPEAGTQPPGSDSSVAAPVSLDLGVEELIRDVFGDEGDKAVDVAMCESELKPDAQRGQFLGLFQMGANERAEYGHSTDPLKQIEAAYRLFLDRGWQPWQCA